MKTVKTVVNKPLLFILVALLSSVFFWATTNRFLYPSRASGGQVAVSLPTDQASLTLGAEARIPVSVHFTTMESITGATTVLRYDPQMVDYVDESENTSDQLCQDTGFRFTRRVKVENDTSQGIVFVTRVIDPTTSAKSSVSGRECFGTIMFRPKKAGVSSIGLETTDITGWEIVGPQKVYTPKFDGIRTVTITVTE